MTRSRPDEPHPATEPEAHGAGASPHGEAPLERLAMRLTRALRRHYERVAAAHDLTPPQATALRHLERAMPMRDLAARMHCDASYITAIADALEDAGWAERRPDPDDRRVRRLALTPAGRARRRAFGAELAETSPLTRALSPEERAAFGVTLQRILELADDDVEAGCAPPSCER